jgi:hypothetical protein
MAHLAADWWWMEWAGCLNPMMFDPKTRPAKCSVRRLSRWSTFSRTPLKALCLRSGKDGCRPFFESCYFTLPDALRASMWLSPVEKTDVKNSWTRFGNIGLTLSQGRALSSFRASVRRFALESDRQPAAYLLGACLQPFPWPLFSLDPTIAFRGRACSDFSL